MDENIFHKLHPDTQNLVRWAGDCSPCTLSTMLHIEKVCDQLGVSKRAPASVHWMYGLYTAPGDAGERLRRMLSSKEVFALSRLWRDHKNRRNESSGSVEAFADWLATELPDVPDNRRRDMLLELWQMKVDPANPSWAELAAEAFGVGFESGESQASFRDFVQRYAKSFSPLSSAGRYALMLTEDGGAYCVDIVQAFAQGLVVEDAEHSHAMPATVFQTWRAVIHPRLHIALGELQHLINSKSSRERDYHRLFETYPELLFLLGNYDDVRTGIKLQLTHVLCPEARAKTFIPDFFLHDSVTDLWDVLEIKPPFVRGSMIVGKGENAHQALGAGRAFRRALKQLRTYGKVLNQSDVMEQLRLKHGIRLLRPRLMLLMGLEESIPTIARFSKPQVLKSVAESADIYTYDQLLAMARDKYA